MAIELVSTIPLGVGTSHPLWEGFYLATQAITIDVVKICVDMELYAELIACSKR